MIYTIKAGKVPYARHSGITAALYYAMKLASKLPAWVQVTIWRDGVQVYPTATAQK